MAKRIKTALQAANIEALDKALKTALTVNICYGVSGDETGLYIDMADSADEGQITQAMQIAAVHDPAVLTTEQQEIVTGVANVSDLLSKVDTALTDLTTKRAAFQATPTLQNAGPLLLEVSQDLIGVLKALKYVLKHIP